MQHKIIIFPFVLDREPWEVANQKISEIIVWLNDNVGYLNDEWHWIQGDRYALGVIFNRLEDATAFKLWLSNVN